MYVQKLSFVSIWPMNCSFSVNLLTHFPKVQQTYAAGLKRRTEMSHNQQFCQGDAHHSEMLLI